MDFNHTVCLQLREFLILLNCMNNSIEGGKENKSKVSLARMASSFHCCPLPLWPLCARSTRELSRDRSTSAPAYLSPSQVNSLMLFIPTSMPAQFLNQTSSVLGLTRSWLLPSEPLVFLRHRPASESQHSPVILSMTPCHTGLRPRIRLLGLLLCMALMPSTERRAPPPNPTH